MKGRKLKLLEENKKIENNEIKICFFGSRTLYGEKVIKIINNIYEKYKELNLFFITSGKIKGVCREVEFFAEKKAIPIILFYPDQKKYGRGKYHKRSEKMLLNSDYVVLIHDGNSKGTINELELVKKMKIPFIYYKIKAKKENILRINLIDQENLLDCIGKKIKDERP